MLERPEFLYDAAPAICQGRRDQQEDTVAVDFPAGAGLGFIVLADGMGGHAAGDIASKIVVTEIFSELKMHAGDPAQFESNVGNILRAALRCANDCVARYAGSFPEAQGMGSTIVAPIIVNNRLYWISVGDSPLYLFRGSRLFRLNEEHSVARKMEHMVTKGLIAQEVAEHHPDRHCLTSVLVGSPIPEIDCRENPIELRDNDILIAASDGLQFISEARIAQLVHEERDRSSAEIGARLIQSIFELDDPDQDNVSLCVLKVHERKAAVQNFEVNEPDFTSASLPWNSTNLYVKERGNTKVMIRRKTAGHK